MYPVSISVGHYIKAVNHQMYPHNIRSCLVAQLLHRPARTKDVLARFSVSNAQTITLVAVISAVAEVTEIAVDAVDAVVVVVVVDSVVALVFFIGHSLHIREAWYRRPYECEQQCLDKLQRLSRF